MKGLTLPLTFTGVKFIINISLGIKGVKFIISGMEMVKFFQGGKDSINNNFYRLERVKLLSSIFARRKRVKLILFSVEKGLKISSVLLVPIMHKRLFWGGKG